jgi:hypothetical protein
MASTVGNSISINIRVFPPSVSSMVTRSVVTGSFGFRRAVFVREAVAEDKPMRRLHLVHVPEPTILITLRAGHLVGDVPAGAQVMSIDRRRVSRWSPPALELARIGP